MRRQRKTTWRHIAGVKTSAEESSKEETQRGKGHKTLFNQKWRKTNTEEALDLSATAEDGCLGTPTQLLSL